MGIRRGMLRLVLLSLGLGVVTTWGLSAWLMNTRSMPISRPRELAEVVHEDERWVVGFAHDRGVTWLVAVSAQNPDESFDFPPIEDDLLPPMWSLTRRVSPLAVKKRSGVSDFSRRVTFAERGAGWPSVAFVERTASFAANGLVVPIGDFTLREGQQQDNWFVIPPPAFGKLAFAFLPAWPGFAVIVLFYGAAWVGLIRGVVVVAGLRRWRRREVGKCEKCGYDVSGVTGDVCPECGTQV